MSRTLTPCQLIERSINKRFRKELWTPFMQAVRTYCLISAGDRIAVCISGGKDSMLLAKLMQELSRHTTIPFELRFLVMNPGYTTANLQRIQENAQMMEIPVEIFDSDVFDVANSVKDNPCYLCARMRRGFLYSEAKKRGCNKIALGHHFNDVIETTVMGMFYGAQLQAMLPKLHSRNFEGMELIRPLYCIHEENIIQWKNYNHLSFLQCACRFTESAAKADMRNGDSNSKRLETKHLIAQLKKTNPDVDKNIFNSIHSCCLDTMVGWKKKGKEYSFLDEY